MNNNILNFLILLIATSFMSVGCDEFADLYEGARPVKFKVTANKSFLTSGENVTFIDSSVNAETRVWTFEGGTPGTSSEATVVVTYPGAGEFKTTIKTNFQDGTSDQRLFITTVRPPIEADFSTDRNYLKFGGSVVFTPIVTNMEFKENTYDGIENMEGYIAPYRWEFEGGEPAISIAKNPSVQYNTPGTYKVKLIATRNLPFNSDEVIKEGLIHVLDQDVISPSSTLLAKVGEMIYLNFGEDMATLPNDVKSSFELLIDGVSEDFSIQLTDPRRIVITPVAPVKEGEKVEVNYTPGTVQSVSGKVMAPQALVITNNLINLVKENGGLEMGNLTNWTPEWDNAPGATWDVVTATPNAGTYCLRFNPLASGRHKVNIELKEGITLLNKKFRLVFAAKASESWWTGGFALVWKQGANPYIETGQLWWANGANNNWQNSSFDISFPEAGWAGTDPVKIRINTDGCTTERYMDDVKFYEIFE